MIPKPCASLRYNYYIAILLLHIYDDDDDDDDARYTDVWLDIA